MIATLILGAALAVGLVRLLHLALPPPSDLAADVGRWEAARALATHRRRTAGPESRRRAALADTLAWRIRSSHPTQGAAFDADLAITETSWEAWLTKTLTLTVTGLLAPPGLALVGRAAGLSSPVSLAVLIGIALAVLMVGLSVGDIRAAARRQREDFRRGLSIYLDLVAMGMEAGRGHAEAMPASAEIGTGRVFTEIRDAIEGARYTGITAWEALGRLGEKYRIPELVDLRGTMALAHDDGAKVKSTLVARAESMRQARLTDALARANTSTDAMRNLIVVMAMVVVVYEIVPQVMRLFTS